ncbi:hypothetical protein [Candidatus Tisiphia endosymbiont of Parasteatoda lunata]|uniref:hypothetical protein n=1 Tax=Candidatus Tisiphia endosymbiont of Parasteatoda lunata TaxID=3066275 RepID=UPI00313EC85E
MSESDDNNTKVDSLPSHKEEATGVSITPTHDQGVGTRSGVGPFEDLNIALSEIANYLQNAEENLQKIAQLKGLEKLKGEQAQEAFQAFKKGFDKVRQGVTDYTDTVHASPIKAFADEQSRENYEKSPIGRLEKFAKDQLMKVGKIFEGSADAVRNNPFLNAVGKVMEAACNAVVTLAKSTLNNAIATGELAKSVVNLGVVIKDSIVGKGVKQATRSV